MAESSVGCGAGLLGCWALCILHPWADGRQCSHVVVRNGRRFLSRAHTEVHASLRIAALNRKKSKLMQVREQMIWELTPE